MLEAPPTADVVIARECVTGLWDELLPLMEAQADEHPRDMPPLDVDTESYELMEDIGRLRVFTARAAGVLIGYAAFVIAHHFHHRQSLRAIHDSLYLVPQHRVGMTGLRLVLFAEKAFAADGIDRVHQCAAIGSPACALFERLGYEPAETIYVKRLGREEG